MKPPDRLTIAANVIAAVVLIFMMAFVANGYGQLKTTGTYTVPPELIDIIKLTFGAAVTVLTLAALLGNRKAQGEDDD